MGFVAVAGIGVGVIVFFTGLVRGKGALVAIGAAIAFGSALLFNV